MFAWILTTLSVVTGFVWLIDKFWLGPKRRAVLEAGADDNPGVIIDFCVSFFPVIFAVFMLRSFVVEPFRIPSGSMIPTLHIGDFILVNKFAYGLRCPVGSCKLLELGEPKHGDVVVFRYPRDPSTDYIKRVIGLPGDHIHYESKRLTVNGQAVELAPTGQFGDDGFSRRLHEDFVGIKHDILVAPTEIEGRRDWMLPPDRFDYDVPSGQYFMMGDNRDSSYDSRGWGTVPEANLKGRAFMVWMSVDFDQIRPVFSRFGLLIH
jgi:signal peptidase I